MLFGILKEGTREAGKSHAFCPDHPDIGEMLIELGPRDTTLSDFLGYEDMKLLHSDKLRRKRAAHSHYRLRGVL